MKKRKIAWILAMAMTATSIDSTALMAGATELATTEQEGLTHTCCLTQGRTHSGSELGEIVGLLQTVVSLLPVAGIYQIRPLRHQ